MNISGLTFRNGRRPVCLLIIGDGPGRPVLTALATELGVRAAGGMVSAYERVLEFARTGATAGAGSPPNSAQSMHLP